MESRLAKITKIVEENEVIMSTYRSKEIELDSLRKSKIGFLYGYSEEKKAEWKLSEDGRKEVQLFEELKSISTKLRCNTDKIQHYFEEDKV